MERDQASKFINDLLKLMVSRNGSDLFITGDFPPAMKVDGKVTKVSPQPLNAGHTLAPSLKILSTGRRPFLRRMSMRGRGGVPHPAPVRAPLDRLTGQPQEG